MKEEKFNQQKYIVDWQKKNTKLFSVRLRIEEKEELDLLLKKNNLKSTEFLRNAIKDLKNKTFIEKNIDIS